MVKYIQDFWILTETGTVIFHWSELPKTKEMQDQMLGMLMSALNSIAEKLELGGMTELALMDFLVSFIKRRRFIFVGITEKKRKKKKMNQEIEDLVNKFFNIYPDHVLATWNGDISLFDDLEEDLLGK